MVYFPTPVFKNIISFIPRPSHLLARRIKNRLPRIIEDRAKKFQGDWRWDGYKEYIISRANAATDSLYYSIPWNPDWNIPRRADMFCRLSKRWHGPPDDIHITVKSLKDYLKMNKIKGYSKKTKRELVALCISF